MAETLTQRDTIILKCLGLGMSPKQIVDRLPKNGGRTPSEKTVEWHICAADNRNSLYHKLGVGSRAELVRYAVEYGIVKPGEKWHDTPKPVKPDPVELKNLDDLKAAILVGATKAANNVADVLQTGALCNCADAYIRVARFQLELGTTKRGAAYART